MHPRFFRARRRKVSTGDATDDVAYGPIDPERIYHISRLAVEDEDSAPTGDIRVLVTGHGYDHPIVEQDSPAAATLYWENEPFHLMEGESLVARFTGAASGDALLMYLEGFWHKRVNGAYQGCAVCSPEITIKPDTHSGY